jgi:hypothetical protein
LRKAEMEAMTTSFFRDLYVADPAEETEEILGLFEPLILDEINNRLCKEFSDEEISDAMFNLARLRHLVRTGSWPDFFRSTGKS